MKIRLYDPDNGDECSDDRFLFRPAAGDIIYEDGYTYWVIQPDCGTWILDDRTGLYVLTLLAKRFDYRDKESQENPSND